MIDISQFVGTYLTECRELLEEMEQLLLALDESPDAATLDAIFRCAHSIKGGGGAFGFTRLVSFTHTVEFLLDELREGRMQPSQVVIDALLQTVDVIGAMVDAAQNGEETDAAFGVELEEHLQGLLGNEAPDHGNALDDPVMDQQANEAGSYHISFMPHDTLSRNGSDPIAILKELSQLGEMHIFCDESDIPLLQNFEPEKSYLSWTIQLSGDVTKTAIQDAFMFVEDECDLEIIADRAPIGADEESASGMPYHIYDDAMAGMSQVRQEKKSKDPLNAGGDQAKAKQATVSSIRVDIDKVDTLVNMVGEMVITQSMIAQQVTGLPVDRFHDLIQGVEELSRHTRELQDAVMAVRMQPVKTIFARLPRLVRDLSQSLGKDVQLEVSGEQTEIDKTLIEQLSDPLTHMIRNSLDHGITKPEHRESVGKPRRGTIRLSADNTGGRIVLTISDDGEGINRGKVKEKALEKGLIFQHQELSDEEIDQLIFHPGFSTAAAVTDVSGRGVGMDVVRRNIAELGGTVELENHPGKGTIFCISLPLTLAILDGMIVRAGDEMYVVPISNIVESMCPAEGEIQPTPTGGQVLNVRGHYVPVICLQKTFSIPKLSTRADARRLVVLVESGRSQLGVMVDEIIGQQQVVIKSLEEHSEPVAGISGATILGDGNVSLILDVGGLYRVATAAPKLKEVA